MPRRRKRLGYQAGEEHRPASGKFGVRIERPSHPPPVRGLLLFKPRNQPPQSILFYGHDPRDLHQETERISGHRNVLFSTGPITDPSARSLESNQAITREENVRQRALLDLRVDDSR